MSKLLCLVLVALALLSVYAEVASCYKVYALSNTLDVWDHGAWKNIGPYPNQSPTRPTVYQSYTTAPGYDQSAQRGLYIAPNGLLTFSAITWATMFVPTTIQWNTTTDTWAGADYNYGFFAFDKYNNLYAGQRYAGKAGTGPGAFVSKPFGGSTVVSIGDFPGTFPGGSNDMASFRNGLAIVVVGSGDYIDLHNGTTIPVSNNVALWDTKTSSWKSMGSAGIASVPRRVVSNDDGTQVVALSDVSTLWRWNGTSQQWVSHALTLTAKYGTPDITELRFSGSKLFIVGNFDKVNGVTCRNVSMISFGPSDSITVTGLGVGLPGGLRLLTVYPRSSSQVFVGGYRKDNKKVVYEWRKGRTTPWGLLGSAGLIDLGYPDFTLQPVFGLIVVD